MGQSCSTQSADTQAPLQDDGPLVLSTQGGNHPKGVLPADRVGVPRPQWRDIDCQEPPLPTRITTFAVLRRRRGKMPPQPAGVLEVPASGHSTAPSVAAKSTDNWRRWYNATHELGRGVSAQVFEAEAVIGTSGLDSSAERREFGNAAAAPCGGSLPWIICSRGVATTMSSACMPERRRQVAIKRFRKVRSRSFQTELAALLRVGVHPHIVRLIESYEDCASEDVFILEYCEGSTVFEAHQRARKAGKLLPELLVARIIRQLLLALEHIFACGIDHQDVKPENMLLYRLSLPDQRVELKLGDFGWASPHATIEGPAESLPADGAGSLWYAPPELNPPIEASGLKAAVPAERLPGRSDMWSVGVVLYLLLTGHNPFHKALIQTTTKSLETEVVRLAAFGEFDDGSPCWVKLPEDAREFIGAMMRVRAADRLPVQEALRHPYLLRRLRGCAEVAPIEPVWRWSDRDNNWARLDGFQRLSWVAVARAATEPEIYREVVVSATRAMRAHAANRGSLAGAPEMAYLWQLARELSSVRVGRWLQDRAAWAEVMRLAFRYLDVDCDGVLSPQDLVCHLVSSAMDGNVYADAWSAATVWVARWGQEDDMATAAGSGDRYQCAGLGPSGFRAALLASPPESGLRPSFGEDLEHEDDDQEEVLGSFGFHKAAGLPVDRVGAFGPDQILCGCGGKKR